MITCADLDCPDWNHLLIVSCLLTFFLCFVTKENSEGTTLQLYTWIYDCRIGDQFVHMVFDTDPLTDAAGLADLDQDARQEVEGKVGFLFSCKQYI